MEPPRVVFTYCTQCRWQLRAQWYAGELLQTFGDVLVEQGGEVAVAPASGGMFRVDVVVGGTTQRVWNRKSDGGFPDVTELKRRVRDVIAPEMSLGHADREHRDKEHRDREDKEKQDG